MVLHQTQPPASVLMVHNHRLAFNATDSSTVTVPEQQLVCTDGTAPDPTTGLCADGSQPQAFNATDATTPAPTTPEQQLVCTDGHCT